MGRPGGARNARDAGEARAAAGGTGAGGEVAPGAVTGGRRGDLLAAALAVVLVVAAALVGAALKDDGHRLFLPFPPLHARWDPHVGPGTPAALAVAALVVLHGPAVARRLSWRWLPLAATGASLAWLLALALVDGWERGLATRLSVKQEYLTAMDDIGGIRFFLRTFTDHIPADAPNRWPDHVAGHPPGATLTFVALDRIGLEGGAWAGLFCVLASATITAAILVTLRALTTEDTARRAAPFLVLAPAAVWLATSADGYFAAVAAWALTLLTLAATRAIRRPRLTALTSGLLFGLLLHLSYGMILIGIIALTILLLTRTWRPLPLALLGITAVTLTFTTAGFWWYDGYTTLVDRYHAGAAGSRPYGYFVWANLAAQVLTAGLATVAALRRTAVALPGAVRGALEPARPRADGALVLLVAGAALAVLVADLSGMSKAETERIWLPFLVWLLPATALLPHHHARHWLAAQAALALTVNHLWLTRW
ncbi:hypothetical protein ACTWP5_24535 [Streptomyces sp. 4N509B]|uniref:hypothetical protein n=1 Tax=Streptomyces sp. 4N509B TaxID=3457413 RepID=UPI003FD6237F